MENCSPLPKNTILFSPSRLQTYAPKKLSIGWGQGQFLPNGQNLTGCGEFSSVVEFFCIDHSHWNNVVLCMSWKYSQIVHFKMVNAEAVPKASLPKKDNHYRYNIMLSFLSRQKGIATYTWKCSTISWFTLKSQVALLFLLSVGFYSAVRLFHCMWLVLRGTL